MEASTEHLLVKDPSQDDASAFGKDSLIANGMNGGYDMENDYDISSTDRQQEDLDKCESGVNPLEGEGEEEEEEEEEEEDDDEDNGMEVDLGDVEASNEAGTESLAELADSYSASAVARDGTSVDKNVESSAVSNKSETQCNKDESMDVDAHSNASDVECLGEEDEEDEGTAAGAAAGPEQEAVASGKPDSSLDNSDVKICEENGSLGSPDIEEITDGGKSNGHDSSSDSLKDTPKKKNKKAVQPSVSITPRRSSRNINRKSYLEREMGYLDDGPLTIDNSSDIEEIKPEDPLAEVDSKDKENSKHKSPIKNITTTNNKTTIVVNDTKRLVEIAAGSKNIKGGKKEPTLVIIDTNSILSGKGGVPMTSSKSSSHHSSSHLHHSSSSSSFSMMPIGMGPQQMYANTRTTITPVPMKGTTLNSNKSTTITPVINPMHHQQQLQQQQQQQQQQQMQQQQILPTLTDDMFVVEAPSFIVPYVYEKPPLKPLKDFVSKLDKSIKEYDKEEKLRKQAEKEKKKAEGGDRAEDDEDDSDDDDKNECLDLSEKPTPEEKNEFAVHEDKNKIPTYFDLPLGKFFMSIGIGLVQEYVQTDLLRTQKRKQGKGSTSAETQMAINSLIKNLEFSKENNEPYHLELKKCEFCTFKTESALAMQHHLETPHLRNYIYKCNFCPIEVRSPHDILFHMEAEHNTRGRLERGPAFHQCPNCPFEDNQKGKLTRHILACTKKFRPERNLEPSMDWEPPAKIPRLNRPRNALPQMSASQLASAMGAAKGQQTLLPKLLPAPASTGRGRGRPPMTPRYPDMKAMGRPGGSPGIRQDNMSSMMYRPTSSGLMLPNSYQFGAGNQIFQNTSVTNAVKNPTAKLLSQPSISITPLPRTAPQPSAPGSNSQVKPGGKSTFVICEICDGYIKDLEQLRNHMQWIHKVKIHPKMIYNRPPLNCQKCQFRFFTDQGLERHLLGSHGLVTSSMQEAANKGKDAGRCPACGRVYQWKLLNHVARDHGMTLKPAHLSYKCTVCTATFGMYKQFENHVYSAHSVVAKRVIDKKSSAPSSPSSRSNDSLLKPLKINDEITIIPQPAKPTSRSGPQGRAK